MVGRAVGQVCEAAGDEVIRYGRQELDITKVVNVRAVFESEMPDAVINCAAWTDVDSCELNPQKAQAANTLGPENLAIASSEIGAGFLTISTDYVFDGRKEGFYTQRDTPNPQSVYANTKLAGEILSRKAYARTVVVRTGFIFGVGGRNFLSTAVGRARRGESITAIIDAWGTPTYAKDLANQLRNLILLDHPGIYHIVNAGDGASYEEFIDLALSYAKLDSRAVARISEKDLRRPAARPRNSRLQCVLSPEVGLKPLPPWRDALLHFVDATSRAESAAS